MTETIEVYIMGANEIFWEGLALALSSANSEGPFDILPGHANFMTLIKDAEVRIHLLHDQVETFRFDQAVLFFDKDIAKIYIHTSSSLTEEKGGKV